jgi:hypothetical protein
MPFLSKSMNSFIMNCKKINLKVFLAKLMMREKKRRKIKMTMMIKIIKMMTIIMMA